MKQTCSVKCHEEGCSEWARFTYDSQKECVRDFPMREKWKCVRHTSPETVLGISNLCVETVMTAQMIKDSGGINDLGIFWDGKNGFVFGNGYKAYAADFPVGTKLRITATVELPTP